MTLIWSPNLGVCVSKVIETKVVIGWDELQLWMWLVDFNYNFELSDNKLSDNKLSVNNLASKLVENTFFFEPITITRKF